MFRFFLDSNASIVYAERVYRDKVAVCFGNMQLIGG